MFLLFKYCSDRSNKATGAAPARAGNALIGTHYFQGPLQEWEEAGTSGVNSIKTFFYVADENKLECLSMVILMKARPYPSGAPFRCFP